MCTVYKKDRSALRLLVTCYQHHNVVFCREACEIRKHPLNLSFTKPRYYTEEVLKTSELFIYVEIQNIVNLLCENLLKVTSP